MLDSERAREILIQHSKNPRNGQFPDSITHQAKLHNPRCGDQIEIQLHVKNENIQKIGYSAKACAICTASASMMTNHLEGSTVSEAELRFIKFRENIFDTLGTQWPDELSSLQSFEHLRVNPVRRTCALLPWMALLKALSDQ